MSTTTIVINGTTMLSCIEEPCNYVVGSMNLVDGQLEYDQYGYTPTLWVCVLFIALFALSTVAHIGQAIRSRFWFLLWTATLCGITEILGWGGRLWTSSTVLWDPSQGGAWGSNDNGNGFLMQICCLIIAPAFLIAANYVILGLMIKWAGPQYCRFHYQTYTSMFVFGDVLSLVIQAAGGGTAASANTQSATDAGTNIMVAGVIWQMVVMVCFTLIFVEFSVRYFWNKPVRQMHPFFWLPRKWFKASAIQHDGRSRTEWERKEERNFILTLVGVALVTLFIFIRSIFRTAELLGGWRGSLETNETLFTVLDGLMIVFAMCSLNIFHPMFFIPRNLSETNQVEPLPTSSISSQADLVNEKRWSSFRMSKFGRK